MATPGDDFKVDWYRPRLDRALLQNLVRRSDLHGFAQALGFLALLALSAVASLLAWRHLPAWAFVAILFVHGTLYSFLNNGFHELVHGTVFRTKALNAGFLAVYSFLSWNNPVLFKASHTRHHLHTLHPPHDLEVVLPIRLSTWTFLAHGIVDVPGLATTLFVTVRLAAGRLRGAWEHALFPDAELPARRRMGAWAAATLAGHAIIVAVSAVTGYWQLAAVTTFAKFVGPWLHLLCNHAQHTGLRDNVPDFRLCARTIGLNPVLSYLYFRMNWHTEHHLWAAVPCYNLARLRRAIEPEMPHAPRGLVETWRGIAAILRRQRREPGYQYTAELPG